MRPKIAPGRAMVQQLGAAPEASFRILSEVDAFAYSRGGARSDDRVGRARREHRLARIEVARVHAI